MSLIIEGGRVPSHWADRCKRDSVIAIDRQARRANTIALALINNMPDAALEDTELQFFELLDIASGDVPVYLKLYSLPGVSRTDRGQRHLNSFYFPFDDLWQNRFDGVIVTGTEPHHTNLTNEPYWNSLCEVFGWAERNTSSTILSCLAAHASVLQGDGIKRHLLPAKKFGVFEATRNCNHALLSQTAGVICFPHSRLNEVRSDELTAAGYSILTKSADAGVDLFVKKKQGSLFVHFQGHPEYGAQTLAKEYRRDIKRFLRGERETYPSMPQGYFDGEALDVLNNFRTRTVSNRCEEMINSFPESAIWGLRNTWRLSAIAVYQNWLRYLESRRPEATAVPASASLGSSRSRIVGNEIAEQPNP